MKHTRTRQVIHAEKLIESTMSTLINGSMALRFQPFNPSAWASPSGSGHNHQNHANTGWNRPQPSRPQNNWQTAQNDWQRPSHTPDNRPQSTRPQNAWRPAQNDWQRPLHNPDNRPQSTRPQNAWRPAQNDWQRPLHNPDNRPQSTHPQNAWQPAQNDWQRPQPADGLPRPGGTRPNQEQCSVRPPQWARSDQTDSTSSFNQYGPRTRQ